MLQQADWKSYLGASMPTRNINNRIPLPACLVLILFALSVDVSSQEDVYRIWKDSTGKYQIDAALISQSSSHVILKNREGKQIEVALDTLSASDLEFLKKSNQNPTASKSNGGSDEMENSKQLKLASCGLETYQMQLKQMA
ncbi:MAG: SHD1 domain-containing protein [Planctomycetota bacterium]